MSKISKGTEDLFDFARLLGQQNDFQQIVRLVAHYAAQTLKADLALVLMLNPDTRETVKTIIKDGKNIEQKEYRDIHIHVGGWIINKNQSFISRNIQKDERFVKGLFDKVPVKSVAGVPLIIEGIIIGALILLYKNSSDISDPRLVDNLNNLATISSPFLRNTQKLREFFNSGIPETTLLLKYKKAGLLGKSSKFIELLHAVEAATKCDVRVLLNGKTGTGKELISKAIHDFSPRANFSFTAIDCGAIPQSLLESELFGHKKGAFTGAHSDRKGLYLEADGGTLFMDEINNLPYDMQSKLLRVIESGKVRPVGSNELFQTNVRIVSASSQSLKAMVDEGKFREDLYYRLHVYPVYIPDLSERQEDIPLLANHFLQLYAKQQNKNVRAFSEEVIDYMKQRNWAGNVRELENFVERMVTLTSNDVSLINSELFPDDLQEELIQFRKRRKITPASETLKKKVDNYEAELIEQTLLECNWNRSEAARRLGTSEKNIRYKIETLNIKKPDAE